jgi:ATP-binding cassette subfamily B protein
MQGLATKASERLSTLMLSLRLVWRFSPGWTVANIALVLLQSGIPIAILYITKLVIDAITEVAQQPNPSLSGFLPLVIVLGVLLIAQQVLSTVGNVVTITQSRLVNDEVTGIIQERTIAADLEHFENPQYHDLMNLATRFGSTSPQAIVTSLISFMRSVVTFAGVIGLLISFSWVLAALIVGVSLPVLLIRVQYSRESNEWNKRRSALQREMNFYQYILTFEHFAKEVRLFLLGPYFADKHADIRHTLRTEELSIERRMALWQLAPAVLGIITVIVAFVFLGQATIAGAITIGSLVMYFQAMQQARSLLNAMLLYLGTLYQHNLFMTNFEEFIALEPRITQPPDPRPFPTPIQKGIRFEDVSFTYAGAEQPVLEGVSLTIRPDEVVALVGLNGAGKTTLAKLLCRLYDPTSGRITVDGTDLRHLDLYGLRRDISVVFQDYRAYPLTVWENIWLGDIHKPPDRERIREAARFAGADDFINTLDKGYDTVLTNFLEGSQELSVGQWQKIAVAKAYYKDASIVIMDEPSSALDVLTEHAIFERFAQIAEGRATLLISHRMSTVRMADRIVVLQNGCIIEEGTHDQLMAKGRTYAHLFTTQATHYE